jgi:hypothetical protein
VLANIERLPDAEQRTDEGRREDLRGVTARAMQHEDSILDAAGGVTPGRAKRAVMQPHFRKHLATVETEILEDEIVFGGCESRQRWR